MSENTQHPNIFAMWSCSRCGPHPDSTTSWCGAGCGRDYMMMTEITVDLQDLWGKAINAGTSEWLAVRYTPDKGPGVSMPLGWMTFNSNDEYIEKYGFQHAEYVAAASPRIVLGLLARIKELENG